MAKLWGVLRPCSGSEGASHQTIPMTSPTASWSRAQAGGQVGERPTALSPNGVSPSDTLSPATKEILAGMTPLTLSEFSPSPAAKWRPYFPRSASLWLGPFLWPTLKVRVVLSIYVHTQTSRHWVRPGAGALRRMGNTKASPAESTGLSYQGQPRGPYALQTPEEHPELGADIPAPHPAPRWVTPGCPSGHL